MSQNSPLCPICGNASQKDYVGSVSGYRRCISCRHDFYYPLPSFDVIKKEYSKWDYWVANRINSFGSDTIDGEEIHELAVGRAKFLTDHCVIPNPPSSILEIGCCEGIILDHYKKLGHEVLGCELNGEIVERARKAFPIELLHCDFSTHDFGSRRFDTILSYHTFEHLRMPLKDAKKCASLLNEGGKVVLELPFGPNAYPPVHHLHVFTRESLRALLLEDFTKVRIYDFSYERLSDGAPMFAYILVAQVRRSKFLVPRNDDFVVLCGNSSLPKFTKMKGFRGAIYINEKSRDEHIRIVDIPEDVDRLYVQNNQFFIDYLSEYCELPERINIELLGREQST